MNDGMSRGMKGFVTLAQGPSRDQNLHSSADTLAVGE